MEADDPLWRPLKDQPVTGPVCIASVSVVHSTFVTYELIE